MTARKPGTFKPGRDSRRGRHARGPAKGAANAGRPPDKFKEDMRALASREDVLRRLTRLLSGSRKVSDDVFLRAFKEVADRGYGKPAQPVEHTGPDGGPVQYETAAEARKHVLRELGGIGTRGASPDED